jgi:regulator of extracellular matrix RemA (YlzA/DUF370 family)
MKLINVGKGHTIVAERIIGIFQFGSRPTIRLKQDFEKINKAINLSGGEAIKALILTDEGYLFLSAVKADTITQRVEKAS